MTTIQSLAATADSRPRLALAGKVGAALFALWGILHLWVGYEGIHQFIASPVQGQWRMFIGGSRAPFDGFAFPTDPETMHVHANLILNLCLDIAGYGVLGLVMAWLLFRRASWLAYLIVVFLVGIADLSFTFLQLTAGIIEINVPTVGGPVIWLLATVITPFGMPKFNGARDLM